MKLQVVDREGLRRNKLLMGTVEWKKGSLSPKTNLWGPPIVVAGFAWTLIWELIVFHVLCEKVKFEDMCIWPSRFWYGSRVSGVAWETIPVYVGVKEPDLWNERRNEEHLLIYLFKQRSSSDTYVRGCILQPRTCCCRFMTVLFSGCRWRVGTRDGDVYFSLIETLHHQLLLMLPYSITYNYYFQARWSHYSTWRNLTYFQSHELYAPNNEAF